MVKVYFEDKEYNLEIVAVFVTEELYQLCLPHLEVQASLINQTVVTSAEEEDLQDRFF